MTLTKKHWIIIGVVASLIAIYFLFIKKRKYTESSFDAALPLIGENGYEGSQIDNGVIESGYRSQFCPTGYRYDAKKNACVKMFTEESGLAGVPCVNDCNAANPCQRCAKKFVGKGTWGGR